MSVSPAVIERINAAATELFVAQLDGSPARRYLAARGLSDETIARWRLGYAPSKAGIATALRDLGWPEATLAAAGLIRTNARGSYEFFRHRLMFPILDQNERVLGFSSRRLDDDDPAVPKYLNSPETPLYKKDQTLYGLPNLGAIADAGEAIVVEGNIDMLRLWDAGIRNVVAACGTALTADHFYLLATVARRIVIVLDSDAAGERATMRSLLFPGAADLDLFVVRLPVGPKGEKLDPDAIVGSEGVEAFQRILAQRMARWDYLYEVCVASPLAQADDVEARIEIKDRWGALVREHATSRAEAVALLGRLAHALNINSLDLIDEYWTTRSPSRDEIDLLLLVALATRWDERRRIAELIPFGRRGAAIRDGWLAHGAPILSPTLQYLSTTRAAEAERAWQRVVRVPALARAIKERLREPIQDADVMAPIADLAPLLRPTPSTKRHRHTFARRRTTNTRGG